MYLGVDGSFETKSFKELRINSQLSKKLEQVASSLLGSVAQKSFTAGNRPIRIISKPTLFSGT
jgi:hypothetical protein